MILSQRIALLLEEMLEEAGGELSIVRNEFASRMGCVPSQINYVITSRFTPERGYVVESRRGGGGFIRIRKVKMGRNEYLMHFYHAVSSSIDFESARVFAGELVSQCILEPREGKLLLSLLSDRALDQVRREDRDRLRARLFQSAILQMIAESEEKS